MTLEYEGCSNLDLAVDITQNLGCYTFAPGLEDYAEDYLKGKKIDPSLSPCFDLKTLGSALADSYGAAITSSGIISRNDSDFVFDYYQPPQEEQEMLPG